ncbi:MAG: translation factor GTPase family protein [Oscillospiraceae bacterium]|nr:translation factor GTPase family protein [Oscillospiraceae bacterium]
MKDLVTGILAHVDAGKTTLSEGMLYCGGTIKKMGRVDHRDAFLDTDTLERERGITIFSKQAVLPLGEKRLILMDTPGHVDFSAEMERSLQVLDYAILVISGTDGVQAHTETLWHLLERYRVPTFLFINKMDLPGAERTEVLKDLKKRLSDACIPFDTRSAEENEELAMCSEELMGEFLESGALSDPALARAIAQRKLFPCFFGSALRLEGVDAFLEALETYTLLRDPPAEFGAKIYKISRDAQGVRLTWLKVTGGVLKPKTVLRGRDKTGADWEEKADQLRLYSGAKFQPVSEVTAGGVCAVTGLTHTYPGEGLGAEPDSPAPALEPVLTYQVLLPEGCDAQITFAKLRELEEEDPMLRLVWHSRGQEIRVQLMGKVQLEVLQERIRERFGIAVAFGPGSIVYKETIAAPVEGVGHFEPLRHYAEVHLLLEPLEPGSGVELATRCSEDTLDRNWQRLVLTHLAEKEHLGVLTGAPITDVRITLLSGRAHVKHTEGGDFREATYRAVRMGLMRAESVLLEPWYQFRLEVPTEHVGRAMADLQRFGGEFAPPEQDGERSVLTGAAPVEQLADYPEEVAAYTKGRGRLTLQSGSYRSCHNAPEVIAAADYRPEADLENSPDSVFCAHGGGFTVKWSEVPEYMHLPWAYQTKTEEEAPTAPIRRGGASYSGSREEEKALEAIFRRTYGDQKPSAFTPQSEVRRQDAPKLLNAEIGDTFLLVDGYNIIFAWDELNKLAKVDLDAARNQLIHILSNYQGVRRCKVILVFDAYKVKGNPGRAEKVNNIFVVYTKQAETADTYIERTTYELGRHYRVRVATSDGMEQTIILGHESQRISARAFEEEVKQAQKELEERIRQHNAR